MKKIINSIFIILCICCTNDETIQNDLLSNNWKLTSIKFENETINISEESYVKNLSYILRFSNDTVFFLDTSVNTARGIYNIQNQNIAIKDYQELTEVGTINLEQISVNSILLSNLNKVDNFNINKENLIIYGENIELIFKKN